MSALCRPLQMPPTAKAVLMAMADYSDEAGRCWPSIAGLCEYTCFGKTAVIEAIKQLEKFGVLVANRADRYRTSYTVDPASYSGGGVVRQADMSGRRTSSGDGGLVRLAEDEVREPVDEVREADTNHQEPPRTISKATTKKRAEAKPSTALVCPDGVDPQTWADWQTLRKAKRAPVTETVLRDARREAEKAGLPLTRFLEIWCSRGSQGLQADWLKPHERAGPALTRVSPNAPPQTGKTVQALMALEDFGNDGLDQEGNFGRAQAADVPGSGAHASSRGDSADRRRLGRSDY